MTNDLFDALAWNRSASQYVGKKRTDIGKPSGTAKGHDEDAVERTRERHAGHTIVGHRSGVALD
jgi:hypothetical protein